MLISGIEFFRLAPRWMFVRVTTDDGAAGWGECIVPKRSRAVEGAVADLASNLVGSDAGRIEDAAQRMRRGGFFRGGPVLATAAAAIEQALWDLKGHRYGLPVYEFLGGAVREHTKAYAWIGGDDPHDVVDHARRRQAEGFSAVKMNATAALEHIDASDGVDAVVERVGALRDALGKDLSVALDFHGRVHRAMAKALFRELQPFDLMWVEEPVAPEYDDCLTMLARHAGSIPIATGERLVSRGEFASLLQERAVDVVQPDVSLTGLHELEKICRMAEAYDVAVAPHSPNGPVSLAASLQVGFCCGNVVIQEQSAGLHYNQGYAGLPSGDLTDYLSDPEPVRTYEGRFRRTAAPGLGIALDAATVESSAADWRLQDPDWRHDDGRYAEW